MNIDLSNEGPVLVIKIDTSKRFGLTGSGKNHLIATTQGTVALGLPGLRSGLFLNVTVHKRRSLEDLFRELAAPSQG